MKIVLDLSAVPADFSWVLGKTYKDFDFTIYDSPHTTIGTHTRSWHATGATPEEAIAAAVAKFNAST